MKLLSQTRLRAVKATASKGKTMSRVLSTLSVSSSCAGRPTSVEVIDKTRSRSSTSCLKVGLCDGTACQHSLMIMYLEEQTRHRYDPLIVQLDRPRRWWSGFNPERETKKSTYSSWVQLAGLSIRCPSFSSLNSSSTGIPGYGEPPRVKISHSNTP